MFGRSPNFFLEWKDDSFAIKRTAWSQTRLIWKSHYLPPREWQPCEQKTYQGDILPKNLVWNGSSDCKNSIFDLGLLKHPSETCLDINFIQYVLSITIPKLQSALHTLAFMSQTFSFPRFKISNKVIKTTYSKEVKEKMSQFFLILLNPILAQVQYKATVFVSLQVRDT